MDEFFEVFPREQDEGEPVPPALRTVVWATEKALKEMNRLSQAMKIMSKMEEMAEGGFENYPTPFPLHPEGNGILAVGVRSSLGRIAGFYERGNSNTFLICGAYMKPGQTRGAKGDKVVERCVEIRSRNNYVKVPSQTGHTGEVQSLQEAPRPQLLPAPPPARPGEFVAQGDG